MITWTHFSLPYQIWIEINFKNMKIIWSYLIPSELKKPIDTWGIKDNDSKKVDFHTHYFIGILACVLISWHFIWRWIIWRLSSTKAIIIRILLIRVLSHLLITCIRLQNVPKRDVLVTFLGKYFVSNSKETSNVIFL